MACPGNQAEKKKLLEGNEHTAFSASVMNQAYVSNTGFTMENPEPQNEVTIFNKFEVKDVRKMQGVKDVNLDQCRFGGENAKPTRLMHHKVDYSTLDEVRCNHPKQTFTDQQGKTYEASHERLAQRKRTKADGSKEFASKALGQYPEEFCRALASCISKVDTERAAAARELHTGQIP